MKTIELEQGSSAWLEYRRTKVMASETAAILGVCPWNSSYKVWLDKIGMGKPVEENEHMRRGKEFEPVARDLLNKQLGVEFKPCVVESEEYPWLGASLDGYYNEWICEIKCPSSLRGHQSAKHGMIPDNYLIQMQQQLLVTGADLCFFCSYFDGDIAFVEVRPDIVAQEMIIEQTREFWDKHVLGFTAPEMKAGDYVDRQDEEFQQICSEYKKAQQMKKQWEIAEEEFRRKLIDCSNGENVRGCGVMVTHSIRKGNIQYDKIPELQGINLDQYRKEPIKFSTIRCS